MKNMNHAGSDHLEALSRASLSQSKRRRLKVEILSAAASIVCLFPIRTDQTHFCKRYGPVIGFQ